MPRLGRHPDHLSFRLDSLKTQSAQSAFLSNPLPNPEPIDRDRFELTTGRFAFLLGILVAVSFPAVLLGIESFVTRDFGLFGYPLAAYHRHCFWNGEIPLWNPLNECGIPFLAQWNTMILYPGSLLYLLPPLPWSLNFFCLVHLYLGGLGCFVLARTWKCPAGAAAFAGIAYAFNGLLQNSLMWPNNIAALGLFPWVVWSVQRCWLTGGRAFVPAALLGATQMLAGAPEVILFTWCFVGFVWIADWMKEPPPDWRSRRGRIGRLVAVIVTVALLAAVQLLPFLSLYSLVDRGSQFDAAVWSAGSFGWLNLLLPLFDTMRSPLGQVTHLTQAWTHSIYAGVSVCALALLALSRRTMGRSHWLGIMLLGFVAISSGRDGVLYHWLDAILPLDSLRFPVKFLIPCSFVLPLLAAIGIREWHSDRAIPTSRVIYIVVTIGVLMAGGGWLDAHVINPAREFSWQSYYLPRLSGLAVVLSGLHLARQSSRRLSIWLWGIVLVACWADLRFHQPNLAPSLPKDRLAKLDDPPSDGRSAITPDTMRVVGKLHLPSLEDTLREHRQSLYCNLNLLSRQAKVDGFYSLRLPRYHEVRRTFYNGFYEMHGPMADFLGVDRVGRHTMGIQWESRSSAMPLATIGQRPLFGEAEQLLSAMHTPRFDPRQIVLFEAGNEEEITGGGAPGSTVSIVSRSSGRIELEVTATAPAIVVLAQAHHPNWRATVDGIAKPIHVANHAFQAVNVPEGSSRVTLEYVDPVFRTGAMFSLLGMAVVLIVWFRTRRPRSTEKPNPQE